MSIISAFMERRRRKRYHRCLIPMCRKASTYYGRFIGGLCTEHAADRWDDLHPEDQARLFRHRAALAAAADAMGKNGA